MKVMFVYPAIGICGFDTPGRESEYGGESCWISHGLASVATVASGVADVELIDMRRLKSWEEFQEVLYVKEADWYGFSISSLNRKAAARAIGMVQATLPDTKIMVGGFDPTMHPEAYKDLVDVVIEGEGEEKVFKLLGGIDYLPRWINRELFDYQRELNYPFVPSMQPPMVTMLAGRGCPYNCAYCQPAERIVHGEYKLRAPEDVIAELVDLWHKYEYKSVLFWDDTFAIDPKWVHEFCEGYKHIGVDLVVNCRADIIRKNPDMMKELKEAGLDMVLVGVESGSQRMLNLINKGTRINDNLETARICKALGVKLFTTFMLGLPTETSAEALSTMAHINALRPEYSLPFYYTPIPGTDLYEFCKEKDLLLDGNGGIERTGKFARTIKGVDYDFLDRYIKKATFVGKELS